MPRLRRWFPRVPCRSRRSSSAYSDTVSARRRSAARNAAGKLGTLEQTCVRRGIPIEPGEAHLLVRAIAERHGTAAVVHVRTRDPDDVIRLDLHRRCLGVVRLLLEVEVEVVEDGRLCAPDE